MIEADDFGVKALTSHADTGEGTLANVIWHLVEQGHMKASSIGFVPTSFTKPGHRDWDTVANKLQSSWKEFSKDHAAKSCSRIITGGVLLEHSFVSVPCNTDAEMIQVVKGFSLADKVVKQLGWEPEMINKAQEEHVDKFDLTSEKGGADSGKKSVTVLSRNGHPVIIKESGMGMESGKDEDGSYASDSEEVVPCECPECGKKRKCPAGAECGEDCKGKMKPVEKEEKSVKKGLGNLSVDQLRTEFGKLMNPSSDGTISSGISESPSKYCYISDIFETYFVYEDGKCTYQQNYKVDGSSVKLEGAPIKVQRRIVYDPVSKAFVEKAAGEEGSGSLVEALTEVLTSTFAFYAQAHTAHWNVVSSDFKEWHDLFGEIYDDAWGAVDPLAENIRKLGASVPANLVQMSQGEEIADPSTDPRALAVDLLVTNQNLIDEIKAAFDKATEDKEQGIANFLADRQDAHSKWGWQLRASLGLKSVAQKGGPGSGNFGHGGVPGQVGGSAAGGGNGDAPFQHTENAFNMTRAAGGPGGDVRLHAEAAKLHRTAADSHVASGSKHSSYIISRHREMADAHQEIATSKRPSIIAMRMVRVGDVDVQEAKPKASGKSFTPSIKVVKPTPVIKVLYTPSAEEKAAKATEDIVTKALNRRMGKLT